MLPYNDLEAVEAAFAEHGDRIAAVITEAAPANMGVVPPLPGFNAALRRDHARHGALLIQDEVLTGFRVGYSGWWGSRACARAGGRPAHVRQGHRRRPAGRRGRWAPRRHGAARPARPRLPGGHAVGNPVATAAGLATLPARDARSTPGSTPSPRSCAASSRGALSAEGVPHAIQWAGNLFSTFFGPTPPRRCDYATVPGHRVVAVRAVLPLAARSGVYAPPSPFEAWFVSAAHDDAAVDRIVRALPAAVRAAAQATAPTA